MEKKNVLEVSVYDVAWVDEKYYVDYDSIPRDERGYNEWWYLHGELERLVGLDCAFTMNCKSAGYSRETINWTHIRGNTVVSTGEDGLTKHTMYANAIIPVRVKGVNEPCVGFFWTIDEHFVYYEGKAYPTWRQRGLVCLLSDKVGVDYALSAFQEKRGML